ncbi:carboxylating nicotinate-nucleotide diphosphorylase [Methanothrix sp.]|uniref:carboxylating nicotinate-nucleotide diphosphorylase n=1 Tax=Methanothrix sp. TaxID=90426 RepID=UPI0034E2AAEB
MRIGRLVAIDLLRFLEEDLGEWDDSTGMVPDLDVDAAIISKEDCILAGLEEVSVLFEYLDVNADPLFDDGEYATAGAEVMALHGSARNILRGERVALNILGRMSGIATLTRECVLRAQKVRVACTRKTTPGFRYFEKKAVLIGGGDTHRFNLSGAVMIKDNHIAVMGLENAINEARRHASFTKKIEVEVEDLDTMVRAAELGADIIMFDNMDPEDIKRGVAMLNEMGVRSRVVLEASGGINPGNLEAYASTGVDVISMGALTRSARWIDFSMEVRKG